MNKAPRISSILPMESVGALLNGAKALTKADRDAICFALETLCRRMLKLEKAHNANDSEMRETHILARSIDTKLDNVRAEMGALRKRIEGGDPE
jgi:hypothetical protein